MISRSRSIAAMTGMGAMRMGSAFAGWDFSVMRFHCNQSWKADYDISGLNWIPVGETESWEDNRKENE